MTVVEQIIKNWQTMSRGSFDEYMGNNWRTLIREEMEQIVDAFNNEPYCEGDGDRYYTETYKED
jgi:hypothetical protein